MSSLRDAILVAAVAASCTSPAPSALPSVRFANAPPVTVVDDRRNVPRQPEVALPLDVLDFYDRSFAGPIVEGLRLRPHRRALGVNALDEVPDSTWFTNRIGVRAMSPDQIRNGPLEDEGPAPHKPWTVHSTRPGGTELGLVITDARGVRYGLSFDNAQRPEMETGSAIVTNRLLWAFGYNVADDRIAYVRPSELVLAPDAVVKDHLGHVSYRLDRRELDRELAHVWRTPDGRIRVVASRWLSGQSLGGSPVSGVRDDDPNDRIPHELRRDLRGQYPLFAWLEHVDLVRSNFLDMYISPPRDPSRHYVVHYKIDLGKSLGTMSLTDHYLAAGRAYSYDWNAMTSSLFTLGLAYRPWGHHWAPALRGVAPTFVATGFDPGAWRSDLPYPPFRDADRFDMFWGTKILARFTPEQIRAAVEAGRFSDPRTVEYLVGTLLARQRATEAYWYARVNPLDRFEARTDSLCFEDLAIDAQLAPAAATRYELASYDWRGRPLGHTVIDAARTGPTCTRGVVVSAASQGYTIVRVTTLRPRYAGTTYVYVARDPRSGAWRVIGIWRV